MSYQRKEGEVVWPEDMAMAMYTAYNNQEPNPWRTWDGKQVPKWEGLNDQVRGKWEAAARCATRWMSSSLQMGEVLEPVGEIEDPFEGVTSEPDYTFKDHTK